MGPIESCNVFVSSGEERFFAVHLPQLGGHAVRQAILDFLKHREEREKLGRLIFEARSKEHNFDFLYQGWDESDQTNIHILQILCKKLDEKIKSVQGREQAVPNLRIRKEGRADWVYDIDLDYKVIRITFLHRSRTVMRFDDIGEYLAMQAEHSDQNEDDPARPEGETDEQGKTLNKHNGGGGAAPSRRICNTRVKGDASLDPKLDGKAQSTTDWNQNLAPTDDGTIFSPPRVQFSLKRLRQGSNSSENAGPDSSLLASPEEPPVQWQRIPVKTNVTHHLFTGNESKATESCDVLVFSGAGKDRALVFAVHFPEHGKMGGLVWKSLSSFCTTSKYEELAQLVTETYRKENSNDFLYQGWDLQHRTGTNILDSLLQRLKYPTTQQSSVRDLEIGLFEPGANVYILDLEKGSLESYYNPPKGWDEDLARKYRTESCNETISDINRARRKLGDMTITIGRDLINLIENISERHS